jgi:hypothetical protein
MTQRVFDRYAHSPIFWGLIVLFLFLSAGLAGSQDRENRKPRQQVEVTR